MESPSIFQDVYSDPEYSEPETGGSDFDPMDLSDPSDAETQLIEDNYDADIDVHGTIEHGTPSTNWVRPPPGLLAAKIKKVVAVIQGNGLTMAEFLDAFSWGDRDCTLDPTLSAARRTLWESPQLPGILRRWHKPPRQPKRIRPTGARFVMETFALECARGIYERELEQLDSVFESPAGEDIEEETLTSISFPAMVKLVKSKAPNLWAMLYRLGRTEAQEKRNPNKKPSNTILTILSILSYTRTHHRGRLQKLFAIYFKFRGLSAKGFDTLHAIGLTMSNKWTGDAVGRISEAATAEMKRLMGRFPWIMSYDNALVAFRVFSQRVDRKSSQGSGTAGTVYIKRSAKPLPKDINRFLQEHRREGIKNPLTSADILKISLAADRRRTPHLIFLVLQSLFHSPDFDFSTYAGRDHSLLQKPTPIRQLRTGKDAIVLQYLLGTLNIPEASYEDNARLIIEWLGQLGFSIPDAQKKLGLEQVMAWIGDQLTIDRLRNLFLFRAEDDNSFERLDWLLHPPGWLHISMAFANNIHKQHLGTAKGRGLSATFDVLKRKGLQITHTQGTFFHDLNETLHIIAEAQIRELWLQVGKTESLGDLRQKSPSVLYKLAEEIISHHASSAALAKMESRGVRSDDVKTQSIMFLRDVLPYVLLRSAVKHGDVGVMEDMIPFMLFRFIGGRNNNYSGEMLELLQGLHREWPPEICDFIRDECWVINNTGRVGGFMAIDEAQEMNIKDIKVTYRSEGPNIDWEYLKKLHPAIHVIRAVNQHMEFEFKTRIRGRKHTVPKKEEDIRELQKWYRASKVHEFEPGRHLRSTLKTNPDKPKDVLTRGATAIQTGKTLRNWVDARTVKRATTENWDELLSDESGD